MSVAAERDGELVAGATVRPVDGRWMRAGEAVLLGRPQALSLVAALTPHLRAVRVIGSAACDFLSLLAGQSDAACTIELAEWDVAAGHAGVLAAGGGCEQAVTVAGLPVLVAGDHTLVRALADLISTTP